MVAIPLVGGSYTSRSTTFAAERSVNLYPELNEVGTAKGPGVLYGTPGLKKRWTLVGGVGGVRGLHTNSNTGRVFAVHHETFYELHADGTATDRGTLNSDSGAVSLASNSTQICLVDGLVNSGYIFTLSTNAFVQIADPDFFGADTVAFNGSYFVFNRPGTEQFYQSALNDGTTYNALDFSSADGNPDALQSVVSDGRNLWLFGTLSAEVWFNSGAPTGVSFDRIDGAILSVGAVAPHAIAVLNGVVAWPGTNAEGTAVFYRGDNFTANRISTHAVEHAWGAYNDLTLTQAYAYQQEGHQFLVWTHPDGTWAYDLTTQIWDERQSFDGIGVLGRHRVCCHTVGFDAHLGGDYQDGRIYEMDLDTFTDDGQAIPRIRRFATVSGPERTYLRHYALEIDYERGVGLDGSPVVGDDPQALLRWSDDHGKTWSAEHQASMGKIGQYLTRLRWRRLGRARDRIYELRIVDPVKIAVIGAELDVR